MGTVPQEAIERKILNTGTQLRAVGLNWRRASGALEEECNLYA